MSGTSLDGADYALCEIGRRAVELREHWHAAFPARLRERLRAAAANECHSWELAQLHNDLGQFYARNARRRRRKPQGVGLHGQTVFHDAQRCATLQIGEPAWLAEGLRVPIVSNFRAGDISAGGQGAPLATIFHVRVFAEKGRHVCVNNLGGISNVTSLDWRRGPKPRVIAFDTGPANMLLDLAIARRTSSRRLFDRDGAWAARGKANEKLVTRWLKHPFLWKEPPKSTGREMFGEAFLNRISQQAAGLSKFDLLATLTQFTAQSIQLNYSRHLPSPPERIILCGGGVANKTLVGAIRGELRCEVFSCEDLGWPAQAIEPAAFAFLAWLRLNRLPGNIPGTTGARRAALLGEIAEP